jgi:hypothetical protein
MKRLAIRIPIVYNRHINKSEVVRAIHALYKIPFTDAKNVAEMNGHSYVGDIDDCGFDEDLQILKDAGIAISIEHTYYPNVLGIESQLKIDLKNIIKKAIDKDEMELAYDLFLSYKSNFVKN